MIKKYIWVTLNLIGTLIVVWITIGVMDTFRMTKSSEFRFFIIGILAISVLNFFYILLSSKSILKRFFYRKKLENELKIKELEGKLKK